MTAAVARRCVLGPVSARLLTAAARFQLPPSLCRDWLSLFQGRGCRAAAAAKSQPDWLMLFIKESMQRVGVRRWTSLLLRFVSNLCSLFNAHIFIFRYFAPGCRAPWGLLFFLSASAASQVEGAVISDWTQMRSLWVEVDVAECLNKPAMKSSCQDTATYCSASGLVIWKCWSRFAMCVIYFI